MYIEQYLCSFENFKDNNAVTCLETNKTFTYNTLNKVTNKLSCKFREDGLVKGDVVMVCLLNTYHFPVAMIGAWKNLQVFSPINFRLAPGEIKIHLEDSKPKVFFFDTDLDETVDESLRLSIHKPDIIISTQNSIVDESITFDDYVHDASEEDTDLENRIIHLDPLNDEIERLYTSGTTGFPKGVRFSSHSLLNIAFKVLHNNACTYRDKVLNLTPWFHQGALCNGVQPSLLIGAHLFALKHFDPDLALDYVEKYKITILSGAPATFNAMEISQRKRLRDLSSLRLIYSMGSPTSKSEFLRWKETFCDHVVNTYGTTETASTLCLRSDIHPVGEKAGSAGKPFAFVRARVIEFDENEKIRAEPDDLIKKDGQKVGQLITKSLGMLNGYHNRPMEEAKKLHEGWFYTGDAASWDKEGFITIRGRTDDMFVSGGENIFPQPVEEVLEKHPKVRECFVVGISDEKWGQVTAAYIVPGKERPSVEELNKHCLNDPNLANYKRPRYYRFVESFPYTVTGKKLRYKMSERAKAERKDFIPVPTGLAHGGL